MDRNSWSTLVLATMLMVQGCATTGAEVVVQRPRFKYDIDLAGARRGSEAYLPPKGPLILTTRWKKHPCVAIDPNTGNKLWEHRRGKCLVPQGPGEAVWVLRKATNAPGTKPGHAVAWVHLDPTTGAPLRTITLPSTYLHFGKWLREGAGLYRVQKSQVTHFNAQTGRVAWRLGRARVLQALERLGVMPRENASERSPLKGGFDELFTVLATHRLWIQYDAYMLCVDLAQGQVVAALKGVGNRLLATAGAVAFLVRGNRIEAYRDGARLWSKALHKEHKPTRIVASKRWVVLLTKHGPVSRLTYRLTAYGAKDGVLQWSQKTGATNRGEEYYGYLALDGSILVYYHSLSQQMRIRWLPTGGERVLTRLRKKLVIGTEAKGLSPAVPSGNPLLSLPYLILPNWGAQVFVLRKCKAPKHYCLSAQK